MAQAEKQTKETRPKGGKGREQRGADREKGAADREGGELVERLVAINRVSKTVKGGRRMAFAAIMVVGDGRGRIGFGSGKAREVPEAIKKATEQAKRGMIRVPLRDGRTLHHDTEARFGGGGVRMRSATPGTGIIAGGPLRAVFEVLGIQDVVAKSLGSSNPYNMVKAALEAFKSMESPRMVAARRGRRVNEVLGRKGDAKEKSDG
ncbi:MAG: 30S ribosomal protein S5 [Phycisphaeraceae bacterium]|nr:30S ribosomal protein S5 [Phycisphaeraceae bacterium]